MTRPWSAYVRAKRCYGESQGVGLSQCITWSLSQRHVGMWGNWSSLGQVPTCIKETMTLMSGSQRASRYQSSCGAHYLSETKCYRSLLVELIRAGHGLCILPTAVVQSSSLWDVLLIPCIYTGCSRQSWLARGVACILSLFLKGALKSAITGRVPQDRTV